MSTVLTQYISYVYTCIVNIQNIFKIGSDKFRDSNPCDLHTLASIAGSAWYMYKEEYFLPMVMVNGLIMINISDLDKYLWYMILIYSSDIYDLRIQLWYRILSPIAASIIWNMEALYIIKRVFVATVWYLWHIMNSI